MNQLISDADRYCSGNQLSPEHALKLAARLQKAQNKATRVEAGLFEVARERVIEYLLRTDADNVRVSPDKKDTSKVIIRPPKGKRAPAAAIAIDRLPSAVRATFNVELGIVEMTPDENVTGLDVRPVDPALRRVFQDHDAKQCISAGHEAESSYDYERALAAYRLAVIRSQGSLDAVRELIRFLSELYADYDEIAELLASPAIDAFSHDDLHLNLAHALYKSGNLNAARERYEALMPRMNDSEIFHNLAQITLDDGDANKAMQLTKRALEIEPGNNRAQTLLAQCKDAIGGATDEIYENALEALNAGDRAVAMQLLESIVNGNQNHPRAKNQLKQLKAEDAQIRALDLITEANDLAQNEQWREANSLVQEALTLAPNVVEKHHELVQEISSKLAAADCMAHVSVGLQRETDKDYEGALLAYQRALDTESDLPQSAKDSALMTRLVKQKQHEKITKRAIEGLAAIQRAQDAFASGQMEVAANEIRDAKRLLKYHVQANELQAITEKATDTIRQEQIGRLLEESVDKEQCGDLAAALAALEEAEAIAGDEITQEASRKKHLKSQLKQLKTEHQQLSRLEKLAQNEDWWRLLRESNDSDEPTHTGVRKLREQATASIATSWNVTESRPVKDGIQSSGEGSDTALVGVHGHFCFAAWERNLILAQLPNVQEAQYYRLPEALNVSKATSRIFGWQDGLFIFDAVRRTLTRLNVSNDTLKVVDHLSLQRSLPAVGGSELLAEETTYCEATDRLLSLVTDHKRPGKLVSISTVDGQVHNEERFSFPVLSLQEIHGDSENRFTVQRLFDVYRPSSRFYNFAVVDGRAHIHERVLYSDLEEPMHALQRVSQLPGQRDGLMCQYWFIDPFRGEVVQESNGFIQTKADWSIFYQNSWPNRWIADDLGLCTPFVVHGPSEGLVLGWKRYSSNNEYGVSLVNLERFQHRWDVTLPANSQLSRLVTDKNRERCFVVMSNEHGIALKELDIASQSIR